MVKHYTNSAKEFIVVVMRGLTENPGCGDQWFIETRTVALLDPIFAIIRMAQKQTQAPAGAALL